MNNQPYPGNGGMNRPPYQNNPQPQYQSRPQPPAYPAQIDENNLPREYKPLGAWAYFGYSLLFGVPIIGIIFAIIFACGGTANINLRNYARSYFCSMLVAVIAIILIIVIMTVAGVALTDFIATMVAASY